MIIGINGAFGAGKTTLARELQRRLPDAVTFDPEGVGYQLWKWLPPEGDFQYLPSWHELVIATASAESRANRWRGPAGMSVPHDSVFVGCGRIG